MRATWARCSSRRSQGRRLGHGAQPDPGQVGLDRPVAIHTAPFRPGPVHPGSSAPTLGVSVRTDVPHIGVEAAGPRGVQVRAGVPSGTTSWWGHGGVVGMRRLSAVLAAACLPLIAGAPAGADVPAPPPARVNVVQAVPGATVDVTVDGRPVAGGAGVGEVLGPFELAPGSHEISFRGKGVKVESTLDVGAGDTSDVVLHLPADVGGDPVVHSYAAPAGPIGPGKARVLLAHTATVAPADVEVDGQTVFTNIANGEFADADVPEGSIRVALLPSGAAGADPILGPLDVDAGGAHALDDLRLRQPARRLDERHRPHRRPGGRRQRPALAHRDRVGGAGRGPGDHLHRLDAGRRPGPAPGGSEPSARRSSWRWASPAWDCGGAARASCRRPDERPHPRAHDLRLPRRRHRLCRQHRLRPSGHPVALARRPSPPRPPLPPRPPPSP